MAYNASPDPNLKKNPNNDVSGQSQMGSPGGVGIGAPGGGAPSGAPAPTIGAAPAKPAGSGRFTNIQQYLDANKGAGGRMVGKITEKGQNQEESIQGGTNQANTIVGSQINDEKNRIAQASGFAKQIVDDPTKIVSQSATQQPISAADNYVNTGRAIPQTPEGQGRGYLPTAKDEMAHLNNTIGMPQTSPLTLEAFRQLQTGKSNAADLTGQANQYMNPLNSQVNNLGEFANAANTEKGRFDLLRQTLGRPNYTRGQQGLDQLLVQNDESGAVNNLQQNLAQQKARAQNAYNTLGQNFQTGISALDPAAAAAQQQLQATLGGIGTAPDDPATKDVDESVGSGALGALQAGLRTKEKAYKDKQGKIIEDINTGIETGTFNDPSLAGMTGLESGEQLWGADLKKYLTPSSPLGGINEQSMADDADLQRYKALSTLSGGTPGQYLTQAGGPLGKVDIAQDRRNALRNEINANKDEYGRLAADKSIWGAENPQSMADLERLKTQYGGADWLNQMSAYYEDQRIGGAGTGARPLEPFHSGADAKYWGMPDARKEQARRLDAIKRMQELNPDKRVQFAGMAPKDDRGTFNVS